jgi:hypothetical protein
MIDLKQLPLRHHDKKATERDTGNSLSLHAFAAQTLFESAAFKIF